MKSQESRTRRNSRAELVFCLKAMYGRTLAIKSEHILRGIGDTVKTISNHLISPQSSTKLPQKTKK